MDNALKALQIAMAIIQAGTAAFQQAQALIGRARAEGRDVTDAELDALRDQRNAALDAFKAQVGAG